VSKNVSLLAMMVVAIILCAFAMLGRPSLVIAAGGDCGEGHGSCDKGEVCCHEGSSGICCPASKGCSKTTVGCN
jgi:hypothetical protein